MRLDPGGDTEKGTIYDDALTTAQHIPDGQ
jgi:hypothetical protein